MRGIKQRPDEDWNIVDHNNVITWEKVPIAVLMDIRAELQTLNRLLGCSNFVAVPTILRSIQRNTFKKKRTKR